MPGRSEATVVYTDGACSGNPGPGGWAWAVPGGRFASGAERQTTNQRMEITAAYEAVKALPGRLEVRSDSTYVVNAFRDRWYDGWIARGWKNAAKKPVANRDLWEPFVALVEARRDVTFMWVKGHSADPMNDVVDRLAVEAALTQQPQSGERTPGAEELGPADVSGGRGARLPEGLGPADVSGGRGARLPEGRRLLVAGHRPPELGGYDANPVADDVRRRLREILDAKRQLHPDLVVVTGLQLGAEQLGAEAAGEAGVPYVAVQPYPEPDKVWPAASRKRYAELIRGASAAVLLERKVPETSQKAGAALARRDAFLARNVDEAVVVWDRDDPAVGKLVKSLETHLGDDVWIVEP